MSEWAEILWGFTKFTFKQMPILKNKKSFIPKKKIIEALNRAKIVPTDGALLTQFSLTVLFCGIYLVNFKESNQPINTLYLLHSLNWILGMSILLFFESMWMSEHSERWHLFYMYVFWETFFHSGGKEWYFCYQNCSDLQWEKIVLFSGREKLFKFEAEGR